MTEVCSAGFPHSDICGSKDICSSPQLFAAYHVFHRLSVPRHPPCALISLIIKAIFSLSYYFRNEYIFDLNRRYCFLFVSMSFDIFTGCLFYLIKTLFDNVFTVCSFQGTTDNYSVIFLTVSSHNIQEVFLISYGRKHIYFI